MPGRRIVLLEMSTEDAEAFVRYVDEERTVHFTDRSLSVDPLPLPAEVVAVVARPTKWCSCNVPQSTGRRRRSKRESGWSRGSKLGWWLCINCRKPSQAMVRHFVTNMLAGANDLLPAILGAAPLTPHERWQRDGGAPNDLANNRRPETPAYAPTPRRRRRDG